MTQIGDSLADCAIGNSFASWRLTGTGSTPQRGGVCGRWGWMRARYSRLAHRGIFVGRDPIAVEIGRMTIALRRSHALASASNPLPKKCLIAPPNGRMTDLWPQDRCLRMTRPIQTVALVGNPNAGKSALFNALTGARQKIANYPGVTVERKSGRMLLPDGEPVELVDLPGSYSLDPSSPDEEVTRAVVTGQQEGQRQPDALILVVDANNLEQHLVFAQEIIALGMPVGRGAQHGRPGRTRRAGARPQGSLKSALGVPVVRDGGGAPPRPGELGELLGRSPTRRTMHRSSRTIST